MLQLLLRVVLKRAWQTVAMCVAVLWLADDTRVFVCVVGMCAELVCVLCVQTVSLAWDSGSRLLAAAAGNDVLVW